MPWTTLFSVALTMLEQDIPDMVLNDWLLPTHIIRPQRYVHAFEDGAWETAYERYCKCCDKQKKSRGHIAVEPLGLVYRTKQVHYYIQSNRLMLWEAISTVQSQGCIALHSFIHFGLH